jgi:NAD(P)-dependent dehydrogenase (short-subunit alcohol dehydrogenase family)
VPAIAPEHAVQFPAQLANNPTAVVTGGVSGIGLAAATRFASLGLNVCIADLGEDRLAKAVTTIRSAAAPNVSVMAVEADVSQRADIERLEHNVRDAFGGADILMNNAGISPPTQAWDNLEHWERILSVNLWGVIHGMQVFVPKMLARGRRGFVINTGSKQGITTPPGNPAYNVSKAGVKVFTEALQYQLRNTPDARITAHLLIPGFVFTGLTAGNRTTKPDAAWTPEQTVDFMIRSLDSGDFYILCPDNDVPRSLDERRILWSAGDIVENRPPLSRWHPEYAEAFAKFARDASE